MLLSIILAIIVLCCVFAAQGMLAEDKEYNLVCPVVITGVVFLVNYFSPRVDSLWLAVIFLLAMIGFFMGLIYETHKEVSEWKELIPFAVLAILFTFVAKAAAAAVVEILLLSGVAATIVGIIPIIVAFATAIVIVIDLFAYQNGGDGDGLADGAIKVAVVVVIVAVILLLFGSCIFGSVAAKDKAEAEVTDEATTAEAAEEQPAESAYHYYNDDVQVDGDDLNDFNFGPNPYARGEDAGYYTGEFAERRSQDPALLSATALALDAAVGTDYIGEILYEGYDKKLDVLQRANAASKVLAENEDIFSSTEDAITDFLAKAQSVELAKDNIKDQLYMNGDSIGGIPQIVVYQSDVTLDWCLVYTFKVKTSSVKIAFRIPCGFQWTNPTEKIQPKAKVSKKPAVVKHDGDKGNGDDPTPTPTPTKKAVKDPSKDPVNQGNANVGGGKNKATDGAGEYQPVKPSKDSGKNAEPEKQKEKEQKRDSSAPPADPIPVRPDSHDTEDKNAGNNNGEFNMDF